MFDMLFKKRLSRIKKRGERYKKEMELIDEYKDYIPVKREKRVSVIMLFVIVISIISYVVFAFLLQYRTGVEISPTITTCWFSFWGCEIVALTGIKISKVFKKSNGDDNNGVG